MGEALLQYTCIGLIPPTPWLSHPLAVIPAPPSFRLLPQLCLTLYSAADASVTVDSTFTSKDIITVAADGTQSVPLGKTVTVNNKGQVCVCVCVCVRERERTVTVNTRARYATRAPAITLCDG